MLENVKGRVSIERNQIIKMDTQNTVCEIQTVFIIFHCAFSPVGALYIILCYCTNISVYTNTAHSKIKWCYDKIGEENGHLTPFITNLFRITLSKDMFQTRLENYEKRLLVLSCLSICPSIGPHSTTRIQLDGISCNTTRHLHFHAG